MPFAYSLRPRAVAMLRPRGGAPTILACDLGEEAAAREAVEVARRLESEGRRKVLLVSDAALGGRGRGALEQAAIDRSKSYDAFVVSTGDAPLPARLAGLLVSLRLESVQLIDRRSGENAAIAPYARPPVAGAKRALFVYPGNFSPPANGAHQRALSTLLDLVEDGFEVDLVVKRASARQFARAGQTFRLLVREAVSYEVVDRPAARGERELPATFNERLAGDVDAGARALVASMAAKTRYDLVVVSFPWMVSILDQADLKAAKIVCDTHDVIFNRRREFLGATGPLPGDAEMREAERELLTKCDVALAISRSDADLLEDELGLANVVTHPMAYHEVDPPAEWRAGGGPLRFGFLGSDMEANRRALDHVLRHWWPLVERFSPESRLFVAGAVTRAPSLWPFMALRRSVVALGPVPDLSEFFGSIDVLLAPSMVQAGVNIKHVEALLRRRAVITDSLGAQSLKPLDLPTVASSKLEFLDIVKRIDRNEPAMTEALDALFREAAAYHGKPRRLSWT